MSNPRYSIVREKEVEYSFWLIFEEAGGVRLTRQEPSVDRAERAMAVTATLPRSLWRTPQLSATISVAGSEVPKPTIDVRAAEAALKGALGVDIDMRIQDLPA